MNDPVLTFGKYKGMKLSQVPPGYLLWLLNDYRGNSLKREDLEALANKRKLVHKGIFWSAKPRAPRPQSKFTKDVLDDFLFDLKS